MLTGLYSIRATSKLYGVKLCRPATSLGGWLTRSRFLQIFPFGWLFTRYNTQKMVSKTSHIAYCIYLCTLSREWVSYIMCVFLCVSAGAVYLVTPTTGLMLTLFCRLICCPSARVYSCTVVHVWKKSSPIFDRLGLLPTSFIGGEKKDSRRAGTIPRVVMSSACARRWSPIAAIANKKEKKKKSRTTHAKQERRGKNLSSAM